MHLDLSVAHIADVKMSSIIDMADPTGANKATIKVNSNKFNPRQTRTVDPKRGVRFSLSLPLKRPPKGGFLYRRFCIVG